MKRLGYLAAGVCFFALGPVQAEDIPVAINCDLPSCDVELVPNTIYVNEGDTIIWTLPVECEPCGSGSGTELPWYVILGGVYTSPPLVPPATASYVVGSLDPGSYLYNIVSASVNSLETGEIVVIAVFVRGDSDGNGDFNGLSDGVFVLTYGFVPGSPEPPCFEAADADGDGTFNALVDGLYILQAAFAGGPLPPPPYPDCGPDPESATSLGCENPPAC